MKTLLLMWVILVVAAVIGWQFGLVLHAPGLLFIPIILVWQTVAHLLRQKP